MERYAAGERNFSNIEGEIKGGELDTLCGVNLSGIDFSGSAFFAEISVSNTDFTRAIMRGAVCSSCNLDESIFREADLSEARFQWASLNRANLAGAKLIDTQLSHADLIRADFTGADLTGADLSGSYFAEANLTNAILLDANLGSEDDGFAYFDTAIFRNTTMPDGSIRNDSIAS